MERHLAARKTQELHEDIPDPNSKDRDRDCAVIERFHFAEVSVIIQRTRPLARASKTGNLSIQPEML